MSTRVQRKTEKSKKSTIASLIIWIVLLPFCIYSASLNRDILERSAGIFIRSASAAVYLDVISNTTQNAAMVGTIEEAEAKTVLTSDTTTDVSVSMPTKAEESTTTTTTTTTTNEGGAFVKYDKVAIVTKIHGVHQFNLLEQSICLLHFAYNRRVLYDIVVFYAEENIPAEKKEALQALVSPAKITFVIDNPGMQEMIKALTPHRRELFLNRCNKTDPAEIDFWSNCPGRIAYNWQAEFRSVHIWKHPALQQYKYMLWLDSDGFCSQPWEQDPIHFFIQQQRQDKAVILFDHFPMGSERQSHILQSILDSFGNVTVADLKLNKEKGHLERTLVDREGFEAIQKKNRQRLFVKNVHGFMHITDLDFFRQPKVWNGLRSVLGDCFMCRSPDDQLAVTIASAIFAPEKALDMRSNNITLNIFHNMVLDGIDETTPRMFHKYWSGGIKNNFPEIVDKTCRTDQGSR